MQSNATMVVIGESNLIVGDYHITKLVAVDPLAGKITVSTDISGIANQSYLQIIETTEANVRKALIGLGWTPPEATE